MTARMREASVASHDHVVAPKHGVPAPAGAAIPARRAARPGDDAAAAHGAPPDTAALARAGRPGGDAPALHTARPGDDAPAGAAGNRAPARSPAPVRPDHLAAAHAFTVASVNLHCGVSSTGEPFDVEGAIRGLDAAIIAVQETWQGDSQSGPRLPDTAGQDGRSAQPGSPARGASDPVTAAASAIGAELLRVPLCAFSDLARIGVPPGSGPGRFGMAVLTTLPVINYEVISLGPVPGDTIPRSAQIVWLGLDDQVTLRLVNTHLTYRPVSPIQLWRLRQRLRGYPGPTIVVGDLNMPSPIASLTAGYPAAVTGRTWPADRPLLQLDHVLASSHLEAVAGTVLPHIGSDHLPVRARLRLRAARPRIRRPAIAPANPSRY